MALGDAGRDKRLIAGHQVIYPGSNGSFENP